MAQPDIAALNGVAQHDLQQLVRELLEAEGATVVPPASADQAAGSQPILIDEAGGPRLVEIHRSSTTPLGGVSLAAIAARAVQLGATKATVVVTAAVDADRQAALDPVLSQMRHGTGVSFDLVDAERLLLRLSAHPELVTRYFPTEKEAEAAAVEQNIPPTLVRVAYAVAPSHTPHTGIPSGGQHLRLVWTSAAILVLTFVPIEVGPCLAIWLGGSGVAMILLAVVIARVVNPDPGRHPASVMDTLIPVKTEQDVGREVTMARLGNGPAGILLDILKQLPAAIVRGSTRTALLLFLIGCSAAYLLLWGLDQEAFSGRSERAYIGDFVNLAVHAAFFNLPDNIEPASRLARAMIGAQFVLSAVLVSTYAAVFGFGKRASGEQSS